MDKREYVTEIEKSVMRGMADVIFSNQDQIIFSVPPQIIARPPIVDFEIHMLPHLKLKFEMRAQHGVVFLCKDKKRLIALDEKLADFILCILYEHIEVKRLAQAKIAEGFRVRDLQNINEQIFRATVLNGDGNE